MGLPSTSKSRSRPLSLTYVSITPPELVQQPQHVALQPQKKRVATQVPGKQYWAIRPRRSWSILLQSVQGASRSKSFSQNGTLPANSRASAAIRSIVAQAFLPDSLCPTQFTGMSARNG